MPSLTDAAGQSALLGSFWGSTYRGQKQLDDYLAARAENARQAATSFSESVECLGRDTVPVYAKYRWLPVLLTRGTDDREPFRFGAVGNFSGRIGYGDTQAPTAFELDEEVVSFGTLSNHLGHPTVVLTEGIDFRINDRSLVFAEDPLSRVEIATQKVWSEGKVVGEQTILWARHAEVDKRYVEGHHGYVVGVHAPSSRSYRSAVQAVGHAISRGTSRASLDALVGVIGETDVFSASGDAQALLTAGTTRYAATAGESVTARGDVREGAVAQGDYASPDVEVFETGKGQLPFWVKAISIDRSFCRSCRGPLLFLNALTPVTTTPDVQSGFSKMRFHLGGTQDDVSDFFDACHADSVRQETDLADLLPAVRINGVPHINPAELLVSHIFRGNVILVRLQNRPGASRYEKLIREIMPPEKCVMLLVSISPQLAISEPAASGILGSYDAGPQMVASSTTTTKLTVLPESC